MRTLILLLSTLVPLAAASDTEVNVLLGHWKLDVSKSTVTPGPLPKSEKRTYAALDGNQMKLTVDGIRADGTEYSYTAAGAMDGTDHPLKGTGMRNAGDTTSWKRIDRHTVESTVKKEGKIVNTVRLQVSEDGRELRITESGMDEKGSATGGVRVYQRE